MASSPISTTQQISGATDPKRRQPAPHQPERTNARLTNRGTGDTQLSRHVYGGSIRDKSSYRCTLHFPEVLHGVA
jgi:hypothetical protein